MHSVLRKIRGLVGTALTWAVGWTVAGFGLIAIPLLFVGGRALFWSTAIPFSLTFGVAGAVVGSVFSLTLSSVHARRRLSDLRPFRMGLWGGAAGLVTSLALFGVTLGLGIPVAGFSGIVGLTAIITGLGAVTAGGTVKLAQMGEPTLEDSDARTSLPG